ncbi:MAG TPA: ABC transporter permease [Solirubrobacteraceae bacterium]|nr:ABC transporter permease [Solirubrobacteraceae bacterium]
MAQAVGEPVPSGTPGTPAGDPAHSRRISLPSRGELLERLLSLREGSIIVVTLLVAIYFSITTSTFLTSANFKTLLPFFAPFAILGAGEVFVMILGEIDLSIGATYLFAPFLYYKLAVAGIPHVPCVLIALAGCMAVGFVNGFFTAIVGISSFVVTLGMLFTLEGLTLIISHAEPVGMPGAAVTSTQVQVTHVINGAHVVLTETVNHVSTFAKVLGEGTYSELIWAIVIVVVGQIVLTFTRWGLYTVSVGSNKLGAAEAGVRVRLVMIRNFMLCSTAGGFVGILEAVRASAVEPDVAGANEILFQGISAAVIGGTLLAGGSGTVVGALIGALFLGILHDGLILKGVNADYQLFYLGLAIILAMTINVYVQRVRRGSRGG